MASCMSRLSVISHIKKTIKSEANFIKQLYDLDQVCSDIEKYYHEYDYSTEKPGNGFRSIVRITDIFFERLHSEEQKCNLSLYPDPPAGVHPAGRNAVTLTLIRSAAAKERSDL